jgi:hypothetical protein
MKKHLAFVLVAILTLAAIALVRLVQARQVEAIPDTVAAFPNGGKLTIKNQHGQVLSVLDVPSGVTLMVATDGDDLKTAEGVFKGKVSIRVGEIVPQRWALATLKLEIRDATVEVNRN